jgi:hypothetical protein
MVASLAGYRLITSTHNPDGTVTAEWRSPSGARAFYLGPPHAKISLVRTVFPTRHGKQRRTMTAKVTSPSTVPEFAAKGIGSSSQALARTAIADTIHSHFPDSVRLAFAREMSKAPRGCRNCHIIDSTCISFFDQVNVAVNGCDNRWNLQTRRHNNYIADDMQVQAGVAPFEFVAMTFLRAQMTYQYPNVNTITHLQPASPVNTNCSAGNTYSVSWFGFTVSSQDVTCSGTMSPYGLAGSQGGGLWQGSVDNGTVTIEPVLQDHSIADHNPHSTLYIREASTTTSASGSCPNGHHCG